MLLVTHCKTKHIYIYILTLSGGFVFPPFVRFGGIRFRRSFPLFFQHLFQDGFCQSSFRFSLLFPFYKRVRSSKLKRHLPQWITDILSKNMSQTHCLCSLLLWWVVLNISIFLFAFLAITSTFCEPFL